MNAKPENVLKGYHWSQAILEETPDDGIFFLSLNMTSLCNYRCPYCFIGHENLQSSPDELSLEEKFDLITQAKAMGCKTLVIPGRGEPMADKDFWKIVEQASSLGIHVVVDTNIYLLTKEKINKLCELPVSLLVKADSLTRENYEISVGKSGVFDRFISNLNELSEVFNQPYQSDDGRTVCRLGVNSVITDYNCEDITVVRDWCEERSVYFTCRTPVRIGEAIVNWDKMMTRDLNHLRHLGVEYANKDFTSATPAGHCGIYRFGITIENTGDIYVCPPSRVSLGNVRERSLSELVRERNNRGLLHKGEGYCFAKDQYNTEGAFTRKKEAQIIRFHQA